MRAMAVGALAMALAGTGGCITQRTPAWTTPSSTAIPVTPAAAANGELVARGEREWSQRSTEAHTRAAIDAWRAALDATPSDAVLWGRLARAQYFLADAFVAGDPARQTEATALFADAASSGERSLLARLPSLGLLLRSGQSFTQVLAALDERDVPGLYWRTLALSRWSRANGSFATQSFRAELRESMARVAQLDRGYDGAGADRFLGDAWAQPSSYQGGDLVRARAHFEYAIHAAPDHLANRVLFALDVATKVQDRALFERTLQEALLADVGDADVAPENLVEQHRARAALDRVRVLFP